MANVFDQFDVASRPKNPPGNVFDQFGPAQPPPQDYDYAGYEKKYGPPDMSGGKHLTDEFKLPNHITFSDESVYSGKNGEQGGRWRKLEGDHWEFTPGPSNLKHHSVKELQEYFKA